MELSSSGSVPAEDLQDRVQLARSGLKELLRRGRVVPAAVLACPDLLALLRQSNHAHEPEIVAATIADTIAVSIKASPESDVAAMLFGLDEATEGLALAVRRQHAAEAVDVSSDSFRVRRERALLDDLARELLVRVNGPVQTWGGHTDPAADARHPLSVEAVDLMTQIPRRWRQEADALLVQPFVRGLMQTRIGVIPLSADIYYQRIFHEMRHADPHSTVHAVSTLAPDLWMRDTDQTHYATLNIEAARRGVEIRRLFVMPETQIRSFEEIIRHQYEAGITLRVCSTALLAHVPDLADFVLFEAHGEARGYISEPSIVGTRPIRSASLILTEHDIGRKQDAFAAAWELSSQADAFVFADRLAIDVTPHPPAPGLRLEVFHVDSPVVTSEDAAATRKIPTAHALKTLLVKTSDGGIVAVHLPGDGRLSLQKVRARLKTATAYLADPDDLSRLGLSPGTVCAILDPVWSMTHLISRRLLMMDAVTTNNGTLTGYFKFKPTLLVEARDLVVDDFEE